MYLPDHISENKVTQEYNTDICYNAENCSTTGIQSVYFLVYLLSLYLWGQKLLRVLEQKPALLLLTGYKAAAARTIRT